MQGKAEQIARLRSMLFLIEEALRIADEGVHDVIGAKLSDCLDCAQTALRTIETGNAIRT